MCFSLLTSAPLHPLSLRFSTQRSVLMGQTRCFASMAELLSISLSSFSSSLLPHSLPSCFILLTSDAPFRRELHQAAVKHAAHRKAQHLANGRPIKLPVASPFPLSAFALAQDPSFATFPSFPSPCPSSLASFLSLLPLPLTSILPVSCLHPSRLLPFTPSPPSLLLSSSSHHIPGHSAAASSVQCASPYEVLQVRGLSCLPPLRRADFRPGDARSVQSFHSESEI